MEQSILKSTKKVLHIGDDDDSFDLDVIMHINSAFSNLNDIGLGPTIGFTITDDQAVWGDFLSDDAEDQVQLNRVKTFIWLTTRMAFDPPSSSVLMDALQRQLEEATWRLSAKREESEWTNPDPGFMVVDGGDPSGEV